MSSIGRGCGECVQPIKVAAFLARPQSAALLQIPRTVSVTVASEPARLRVAPGKDVQTPAADEFDAAQRNFLCLLTAAPSGAGACPKHYRTPVMADKAAVGDWSAGHVR